MHLESLGADTRVLQLFEPHAARGLVLARVAVSQRNSCQLLTESGECRAEPSGALWYHTPDHAGTPVTGDWVAARVVEPEHAIIEAVLPRKAVFSRRAAGRREDEQPVAANIDLVFVVCGLDADFNLRRLERYLVLAAEAGTDAVVVLNKSDLCEDVEACVNQTMAVARGVPVVAATTRAPDGLDKLRTFLAAGRTVALLGSSGVGKSAIVNGLVGAELLRTNQVRLSDGRGQHTTTSRELIVLRDGSVLIDTPGMREVQLWAGQDSVDQAFDDIAALAAGCRFRNCRHSGERDCAVAEALRTGTLTEERWNSYRKLTAEVRRHEQLSDPVAAADAKKHLKALHRGIRSFYRHKNR